MKIGAMGEYLHNGYWLFVSVANHSFLKKIDVKIHSLLISFILSIMPFLLPAQQASKPPKDIATAPHHTSWL